MTVREEVLPNPNITFTPSDPVSNTVTFDASESDHPRGEVTGYVRNDDSEGTDAPLWDNPWDDRNRFRRNTSDSSFTIGLKVTDSNGNTDEARETLVLQG